ncbi:RlpA-like double-psi beta-barrel-protein domain-containing protein-containing protein [Ephemerocybe angulata]|uniref:RlpA-like double-psi beta-barrel-protein domain-containing protein-containing protein n=1 Tax=Ephemerocybe angulata TaxID=980116 RepID=A0A8H6IEU6_9AGAR|nr:RlpA-like double-psi beta-barrel-protein domain-containing protein-containing protein [Tulosesus angulatus]
MSAWIQYPQTGLATLTHYTLPAGYVASCGCTPDSTKYPTAALSQMAYGSSANYGPGCGRCFKLSLLNPLVSTPPFVPSKTKSVVVKITDLCPFTQGGWCGGTTNSTNSAGAQLNFDLAYPSKAIPDDFFPSDEKLYGYKDFGVWNITYESVSCYSSWAGSVNPSALGSVRALETSACCPAEPTGSSEDTCPSYSDKNGLPPDTSTKGNGHRPTQCISSLLISALLISWIQSF